MRNVRYVPVEYALNIRRDRRVGLPGGSSTTLSEAVRDMVRRGIGSGSRDAPEGHKTRSVFERYNIVSDGELRKAARRLDGYSSGYNGASDEAAAGGNPQDR